MQQNSSPEQQNAMYSIARGVANGSADKEFVYCLEEGRFYVYDAGIWRIIADIEILSIICHHPKYTWVNRYPLSTRNQIIENLKLLVYKNLSVFNQEDILNFKEGLLDMSTVEMRSHSSKVFSTTRLPYSYDKDAKCDIWRRTLKEIFEDNEEKIGILQEFFGYCLTRDIRKEKALLLLGESRTGKSTILHILRNIVGNQNCSSVPLKFLSHPQYTPLLIGKLVNIDSDVSAKAQDFEAEFKIITSGEPVSVNQKFVATFDFHPYCKLVMAANEFPRINDHSSAFYKRLILIPCDRVFTDNEQNLRLKDILLNELPGILNWAITGAKRLNERGRFPSDESMKQAISDLRSESNPMDTFCEDYIEIDQTPGIEIEKHGLYLKYSAWCKQNGNVPMANNKFSRYIYLRYSKITPKDVRSNITGLRVWRNIKFIDKFNNKKEGETISWQE